MSLTRVGAELLDDAAFATRMVRRQWHVALLTILCLALGIGATTSMFSVANALLLRPLPLPNAGRIVVVGSTRPGDRETAPTSYIDYLDWRERQHAFDALAAYGRTSFTVSASTPINVSVAFATANYFKVLGVAAVYGRLLVDEDDRPGAAPVAIVSLGFAERELGGASGAPGRAFVLGNEARSVIGVVADLGPMSADVWVPVGRDPAYDRSTRNLTVLGALPEGTPIVVAQREMARIAAELARERPQSNAGISTLVTQLRERYAGPARPALFALFSATILVLLVTCANVAGIQLARAVARTREITIRSAIGASPLRLVRQLLTESVLLSLAGGIAGVGFASWSSDFAARAVIGRAPGWLAPSLDVRVLAFAVLASSLAGLLFGVAPALRLARTDASDALRGGRSTLGTARPRLQRQFVAAQIALSIVLVVAAGLAIESVRRVERVPLGFRPDSVVTFSMSMQTRRYDDPVERGRFISLLSDRLGALPGVRNAGAVSLIPIRGGSNQWKVEIEGRSAPPSERLMITGNAATRNYFRTMGIALVRGRTFTMGDDTHAIPVLVVNETFARRFWPGADALGHRVMTERGLATVVGVVADVKQGGVLDSPEPQFYWPATQLPTTSMSFVLSTAIDLSTLARTIRATVHELDPGVPPTTLTRLSTIVADNTVARRTFEWMLIVFGGIALGLAATGIFAVMSFHVSQRSRELGLRIALGAEPSSVAGLVLRQAGEVAVAGTIIGLLAGGLGARWLAPELYGVSALEPKVYAVAAAVLAAAVLAAVYGPVRRAVRLSPLIVLQAE